MSQAPRDPRGLLALALTLFGCASTTIRRGATSQSDFERRLEERRIALQIPGFSAAITNGAAIVWAKGFGLADVEAKAPATPTTVYHMASLTKPVAATILLQLVEEGKLSLDDPVSRFGITLQGPGIIRVRHLLTHTSEGIPGSAYNYNGNRFSLLDSVITRLTGESFANRLEAKIRRPLRLERTAPNPAAARAFAATGMDRDRFIQMMARPYEQQNGVARQINYPTSFSTAAGLVSTALDYAEFSIAMDTNAFLKPETTALAYTPALSTSGDTLPYGLGWFSTRVNGQRVVWHYGYWTGNSSLVIKVPARGISFVIMANSDMLSRPTSLGSGDLMSSTIAREFINAFVVGNTALPAKPIAR